MFLRIVTKIVDFIYPHKCLACRVDIQNYGLCSECFLDLKIQVSNGYCYKCGYENPSLLNNVCGFGCADSHSFTNLNYCFIYSHNSTIDKLLHNLKYSDNTLALDFFAKYLLPYFRIINPDIIVVPPIYYTKIFRRKYHHLALIARKLIKTNDKYSNTTFLPKALKKGHNTKNQMSLNQADRLKNLNDCFVLNKKYKTILQNKKILILEDIVTTGATIYEMCKELNKANPKEISILSVSKVQGILKK